LTDEELSADRRIMKSKEGTMMYHHRNAYVFASYAAGIRISDLLTIESGKIVTMVRTFKVPDTKNR
jgi:site-specific recombinase XerD